MFPHYRDALKPARNLAMALQRAHFAHYYMHFNLEIYPSDLDTAQANG